MRQQLRNLTPRLRRQPRERARDRAGDHPSLKSAAHDQKWSLELCQHVKHVHEHRT